MHGIYPAALLLLASADLVAESDSIEARFSAERWFDFRRDARYFRQHLGTPRRKRIRRGRAVG